MSNKEQESADHTDNSPGPAEVASETQDITNETPAKTLGEVQNELDKAIEELNNAKEEWLRAKAETENIRKRAESDVAAAHKYALERFSTDLLSVKDSLEAAMQSENNSVDSIKDGVDLTLKQLVKTFDTFGIIEVNPVGETLDPHKHQAMSVVESDQAPNTIVSVFQKGYLLNDRLIRPALVSVAKAKDQ
jgi:molecular chaperone GrpE